MGSKSVQPTLDAVLRVGRHRIVTREQLMALGLTAKAIRHRVARGRLFMRYPGVYAVGTPDLGTEGEWTAAVLACGERALLSHRSAGRLWGVLRPRGGPIEVSAPADRNPRPRGVRVHRRAGLDRADTAEEEGIPVTSIVRTMVDLAAVLDDDDELESVVNEADRLDRIDPEALRRALESRRGQPGVGRLRKLLDRRTFRLTDSELERRFLPIARRAGLPVPLTRERVNGFRVDFYWPDLGLVVETDGLRHHRTPTQQTRDRRRDQTHTAAGVTPLRFTHTQVRYEPCYVEDVLGATARRLRSD